MRRGKGAFYAQFCSTIWIHVSIEQVGDLFDIMLIFKTAQRSAFSFCFCLVLASCAPSHEPISRLYVPAPEEKKAAVLNEKQKESVRIQLQKNIPSLSIESVCHDVVKTRAALAKLNAKIIYDPNETDGTEIPFIVFEIDPKVLLDDSLMAEMDLEVFNISSSKTEQIEREKGFHLQTVGVPNVGSNFPSEETGLNTFRAKGLPGADGSESLVAVIDTGIDVTHPFFQNRVTFLSDETDEGRFVLEEVSVADGKVVLPDAEKYKTKELKLPEGFKELESVKVAMISEAAIAEQSMAADPKKNLSVDLNLDGDLDDSWLVVVGSNEKEGSAVSSSIAFVDYNGDGEISGTKELKPILDFNSQSKLSAAQKSFFDLSFTNKKYKYPLLFDMENDDKHITLFADFGAHGTHVSGIIGGNDEKNGKFIGVAPRVKFMGVKALSSAGSSVGISVSRAVIKAVYNSKGLRPDVINLSLGSSNEEEIALIESLMRDIANRTGVVFVISASNSGPAFYTLNGMGKFGPFVSVGAFLSRSMISKNHVSSGSGDPEEQMYSFSSVGPSFTGEIRPNIVAPGGMVSSVPLAQGALQMMQGTSMSAPYVTGVIASVLSALKKNESTKSFWNKQKSSLKGDNKPSLSFMPMTIRQALELSAKKIPKSSPLHQGNGLIQVGPFFEMLKDSIEKSNLVESDFILNGNEFDADRSIAYHRSGLIEPNQVFKFSLPRNSRFTHDDLIRLKATPLKVKLSHVYVQSAAQSNFEELTDKRSWPFYIFSYGEPEKKKYEYELNWASDNQDFFRSARVISGMNEGSSYLAEYELWWGEQRIQKFADLVHKPSHLPAAEQNLYDPVLEQHVPTEFGFEKRDRVLNPGEIHRYFFYVPRQVGALQFGIRIHGDGMLQYAVTKPTGIGLFEGYLYQDEARGKEIKTSKSSKEILAPGIYELTIANYDTVWSRSMKYSFLVAGHDYKQNLEKIVLTSGGQESVSLSFSGKYDGEVFADVLDPQLHEVEVVKNLKTFALHETLVPVTISKKSIIEFELDGASSEVNFNPSIQKREAEKFAEVARGTILGNGNLQVVLDAGDYYVSVLNDETSSNLRGIFSLKIHDLMSKAPEGLVTVDEEEGQATGIRIYRINLKSSENIGHYEGLLYVSTPFYKRIPVIVNPE